MYPNKKSLPPDAFNRPVECRVRSGYSLYGICSDRIQSLSLGVGRVRNRRFFNKHRILEYSESSPCGHLQQKDTFLGTKFSRICFNVKSTPINEIFRNRTRTVYFFKTYNSVVPRAVIHAQVHASNSTVRYGLLIERASAQCETWYIWQKWHQIRTCLL